MMKKYTTTLLIALTCVLLSINTIAQGDSPIQLGADLLSRYIWRGLPLGGNSPSIQPTLKLNLASNENVHVVTVGAWGAYSISELTTQEFDLFLAYTYKGMIGVTVTDYFFPSDVTTARNKYFDYGEGTTGHVLEGALSFNGTSKLPFTLLFAVNFYGADKRVENADTTAGPIVYSKYIEAGYFRTIKGVEFKAFIGAALDDPNKIYGHKGYYLNLSAGVVNVGITAKKNIPITDRYALPVQASLIFNPEAQDAYLVFGISL